MNTRRLSFLNLGSGGICQRAPRLDSHYAALEVDSRKRCHQDADSPGSGSGARVFWCEVDRLDLVAILVDGAQDAAAVSGHPRVNPSKQHVGYK